MPNELLVDGLRIDELRIPTSMDDPGAGAFAEMVDVRNAIEADILGSDALAVGAAELLPFYQLQQYEPKRMFVAMADGRIVGRSILSWSAEPGSTVSWLVGEVLREYRGRGVGTALFDHLEGLASAAGRTTLQAAAVHTVTPGGERVASQTGFGDLPAADPGVRFMLRRGYTLQQIKRVSFLDLPVDPGVLAELRDQAQGKAGDDYRIVEWTGRTPPRWLGDIAVLKGRMSVDEPSGGLDNEDEAWDEGRVVATDSKLLAGGQLQLTVAVEHRPTGRLAGHSELWLSADRTRPVQQHDTLVLAEHRGHRLGMLLKVANLQQLARVNPGSMLAYTFNAEENRHMLDVNEAVGYRPVGAEGAWRR